MKKYFYVLLFVAGGICITSCNKDDDNPSPKSDAKQILSFVFKAANNKALNEDVTAEINQEDKTITATVPFGTELTSLLPEVKVSEKAAVSPTGAQDFSNEVTYTVTAENGTKATYKVIVNQAEPNASDAKQILSFVFKEEDNTALNEDVTAAINQEDKTITATVPFGTELTSLLPEVKVSEKAAVSPTGAQDFSSEVDYVVTAENGTKATYKVSVKKADPGTGKQILSFVFKEEDNTALNEDVTAEINQEDKTITATVPFGTELASLLPLIEVSEEATVSPAGAQDFTNEVAYTVTAQDGTQAIYKISVEIALNNANKILSFVFKEEDNTALNEDVTAAINQEEKTITATFPFNTDVTSLLPLIEVSEEATVSPAGAQDFTNEVIFTVTAQDQTQEHYTFKFNFTAPTQREVLIAIYNSNPGNTLGWDINNEDISSWVGVTVDDQGRVIKLVFVDEDAQIGYGLVTLPAEIGQLTSLVSLSLYNNQLTSIPAEIGQLTNLEFLDLGNNQLTNIPAEIGQLTSLETLYLDNNQLTSIPAGIGQLTNLEYLFLYNNQLTSIPTEIGQLTKLKYFYLYENELTSIPAKIGQLTSLETLNLKNNPLTSIPSEVCNLENNGTTIKKDDNVTCETAADD
ncbi:leucine-rich repeat domain-containing protein [Abyssalbus ytuae]|uniref:Leucine-rich repeat domain-containing protein n=1 Tax=Abyssalbus ytuae TaxID=2926907 RepID=A0A9E6ZMA3_9FLAO|nr:leucine-rich repeat domain-containing protein [Abyssalbus ytuae]UOB16910.1 leucine-rich repeat domain-containing protein [Abyssalbus ytuae]